jgi:hypothetical protein
LYYVNQLMIRSSIRKLSIYYFQSSLIARLSSRDRSLNVGLRLTFVFPNSEREKISVDIHVKLGYMLKEINVHVRKNYSFIVVSA